MTSTSAGPTCDLLIIGGGPAGLAAAAVAASHGLRTVLVDERPTLGGQIYRQPGPGFVVHNRRKLGADFVRGQALVDSARRAGARLYTGVSVVSLRGTSAVLVGSGASSRRGPSAGSSPSSGGGPPFARARFFTDDRDLAERTSAETPTFRAGPLDAGTLEAGTLDARTLHAGRVLIAPGAYDRPVVFPGWTLPGVITAGGAQALVKASRVVPGDRVAFAGSGPLALAFPAQLHHYGVNVVLALEAGPPPGLRSLVGLVLAAPGNLALLRDGASYRLQLQRDGVPLRYRRVIVRAEGKDRLEGIVHAAVDANWRVVPGSEETVAVDTVCVGYGFVPSVELFRLAGCEFGYDEDLGGPVVEVDEWRRTSVPGILAAGDGTGVRGSAVAADQGRLAALGAAVDLGFISSMRAAGSARPLRRRLCAKERFRRALRPLYGVGQGIYELATPETVVCRCEEVTLARIEQAAAATRDANVVKSYTRAGMGLCQGRNCQRQVAAVVAQRAGLVVPQVPPMTARPPVRPVPLGILADESVRDEGLFVR